MKIYLQLFTVLVLFSACRSEPDISRPNIVYINIDDLGWKDVGFNGNTFIETPVMDALASESLVFSQAYAAAANCAPSRASMMTGTKPQMTSRTT